MEWKVKRVQRGGPIDQHDGMWLDGHTASNSEFSGKTLEFKFKFRRNILATIYFVNVELSKILIIINTL
jgi:hypothetical protein